MKKKILFISHDASMSGAPLILLNFIRWGKAKGLFEPLVVLLNGGPLESDFMSLGRVWNLASYHTNVTNYERLLSLIKPESRLNAFCIRTLREISDSDPILCYANTLVSIKFFNTAKKLLNLPILMHVHEMKFSAYTYYGELLDNNIIEKVDRFICVSNGVKNFLNFNLGVGNSRISVIPPFFINHNSSKSDLMKDFGFTLGISGLGTWQKGIYVLPFLVKSLVNKFPSTSSLRILWMGHIPSQQQKELYFMLDKLNFEGSLEITGYINDTSACFQSMDVFVSLSMEDSFPIACMEAINHKLPLLAFRDCGGATDLIDSGDCGYAVSFLDTDEMSSLIFDFSNDKQHCLLKGNNGFKYSSNFTLDQIAPKIWDEIESLF